MQNKILNSTGHRRSLGHCVFRGQNPVYSQAQPITKTRRRHEAPVPSRGIPTVRIFDSYWAPGPRNSLLYMCEDPFPQKGEGVPSVFNTIALSVSCQNAIPFALIDRHMKHLKCSHRRGNRVTRKSAAPMLYYLNAR